MITRFYVNAIGVDENSIAICVRKAMELAKSDDEIQQIVLYSNTMRNFKQMAEFFEEDVFDEIISREYSVDGIRIVCATETTYKRECKYQDYHRDVVICCHMDSKAVFKVDDYETAKYIIALSRTSDGLDEWKKRWNAQNLRPEKKGENDSDEISKIETLLKIALDEMNVRMYGTKTLGHPNDIETCKTYIRAIHKYLPENEPQQVKDYLVTKLGWKNKDAAEVGNLLQKLKDGKRFIGGQKTHLKEYYDRWKER